jgi:parallel beta-helix repeat protein
MKIKNASFVGTIPIVLSTLMAAILAGCGGSGGQDTRSKAPVATSETSRPAPSQSESDLAALASSIMAQPPLPMPSNINNDSVLELLCGRVYQGTLDLKGKSNVTVRTAGTCGAATITPGQSVAGWTLHQGNVYSAPVPFDVAQVLIDGQPQSLAHWPGRSQTWAKATSSGATSLAYAMPNNDLAGATLVFRAFDWSIDARRISAYSGGAMTLGSTGNPAFDGYAPSGQVPFYVEGKLWMLDEPGEWAVSSGRLYVWAPDGKSPEGRVWGAPSAASSKHGIDASTSTGVIIDNVRVYGAANGINAVDATDLAVSNTDIVNSSENGIVNSGGSGLSVTNALVRNSRHDGILVRWGGGRESIRNSRIDASGVIGMPTNAHAAIYLAASVGAMISGNTVTNAGYIGIRFFRNATVSGNTVDSACLILSDCGGLYTSARDALPLDAQVTGNTIKNVGVSHRLAWAIQLDDSANAVTIADNTISANGNGLMLFDSFNNAITGNTFTHSNQAHIQMAETANATNVRNNRVSGNRFVTRNSEETYRISSDRGVTSVTQFGTYSDNRYESSSSIFANFNGEALNFSQWKTRTGQDGSSIFSAP